MSMEFQITQDDVETVLRSYNASYTNRIDEIMDMIDDSEVSNAAMSVDIDPYDDDEETLMKQTEVAYDEIAWQLYKEGFITKNHIQLYGNTDLLKRTE